MALSNVVDSSSLQELLDAEAHVWNHIYNYINSMSLKCAIQLGIPDVIHKHGKPMTLPQLTIALSIDEAKSHALFRLMRILVHSKFFKTTTTLQSDSDDEEATTYGLTLASRLLLRDEPSSLAPLALALLDPDFIEPFHHLSEWIGTNGNACPSPFVYKYGKSMWEYVGIKQDWNQLFNESMANDSILVTSILVKECKHVFEGLDTMVDVAGGTGKLAKAIVHAFPDMKGIVLDLPHVVASLKLEESCENLKYVSGDMFEFIPHADATFLKWILHNWSDEECVKILKKCKEAIAPSKNKNGGKVIIVDMILENKASDHDDHETQLMFEVLMMTLLPGKERIEKELANLFFAAGFKSYKIYPLLRLRSLIEVYP